MGSQRGYLPLGQKRVHENATSFLMNEAQEKHREAVVVKRSLSMPFAPAAVLSQVDELDRPMANQLSLTRRKKDGTNSSLS